MNAPSEQELPAAGDAAAKPYDDTVAPLAEGAVDVMLAWARLLNLELTLAQHSLHRLLIGAIALPVVGLSAWLGLSVLLVAAVHIYTDSWLVALASGTLVQWLTLAILMLQLRHWARDLTMPQSRAALVRAMKSMS